MIGKKSFEQTLVKQIERLNQLLEKKDDFLREVTNENIQIVIINEKIKNSISSNSILICDYQSIMYNFTGKI